MDRIIVIGCPGAGKSTFSRALNEITGIPLYHLDMMYWNSDRSKVERDVFLKRLNETLEKDEWIIDGNYGSTMALRMERCDTVIFLDYPSDVCVDGIIKRCGKKRSDMPWSDPDEVDNEFIKHVKGYATHSRPQVMTLLSEYRHKDIHLLKSREEAENFLRQIKVDL